MADLFSGGAVGALMGEALHGALETVKQGLEFKPTLERNIETLNSLSSLVEDMKRYNQLLDRPMKEIERLEKHIQDGEALARKCSKFSLWRFFSFPYYQSKLQGKDENLKRHLSVNVSAENKRDMMEILLGVRKILEVVHKREDFGQFHGYHLLRGLSGAPDEPHCLGMDEPLNKLSIELLKDTVPILVLTGLGGSGKTTLAKKLCYHPQIKGKFKENIFFITVSKTPDMKTIAQALFEHCGCKVPEFQTEEDATNKLKILLKLVGKNPMLLVLDDVPEALVENFIIQMKDYKILVTSRVAFRRFGTPCQLDPLGYDQAVTLFRHYAQLNDSSSKTLDEIEDLVPEIVRGCKGSPLALKVIGGSLCHQPFVEWQNIRDGLQSQSILESSNTDLLHRLQQSLEILGDKFSVNEKECFMDLGLFPEGQRIPVPTLIDMWTELHKLDEDGRKAMTIIHDLDTRNLINLIVTRKVATDADMYYNNHFVMLHDLLRELAIYQSKGETFKQTKRLTIELKGDKRPECWVGHNQQGIVGYMFSLIPGLAKQKQQTVAARILSISTDETFDSEWCDMQPDEAEVLILNIRSSQYSLPEFTEKMSQLKVLILTNYGFHHSELNKFELLGFLPDLRRIRLEKISVPSLCALKNLRKLSLYMCNTRQVFENCSIPISDAMPNLVELSIDYCNDLVKLPDDLCNITSLKKFSITNCHRLSVLPREIAKLENLKVLRLCSCSDLQEMPDSVGGLNKLHCLDFSDCLSLSKLPEDIGDLKNLRKLYIKGCSRLSELPYSVINFQDLKHEISVICDEEGAALWEVFPHIPKLKIDTPKIDVNLNWLHGLRS